VALVTDGRMSGASGKVPAAIHLTPECLNHGPLHKVRDGDVIHLDSYKGILEARVPADEWSKRTSTPPDLSNNQFVMGRELFSGMRKLAGDAEAGAGFF